MSSFMNTRLMDLPKHRPTFIEVLVGVVIVGILVAVVIFAMGADFGQADNKHCDGTTLVYDDYQGNPQAVIPRSPECGYVG